MNKRQRATQESIELPLCLLAIHYLINHIQYQRNNQCNANHRLFVKNKVDEANRVKSVKGCWKKIKNIHNI
ncbi:hypothetical protein HMPREF0519_0829 [Lentilactobacillus hilgardii DSM 20176 = ATCC 8290]|uniref:Uncharacterized protein n=1 Tax=Lentilactobacillus hilgardii (strain ATCC 8290 / DSM 20176 / CCUG 30140 / JCM 1155 / KCTC 3500 / NBRC 15886 / NCIMB 8040 / NRRL B-1843 / 9) TaxID=1423757 RepID=C0XHW8_LENH9|nr:hypothetical protein HMPREF0519_0829 [Lentilactobacillus hilgardii DSM 20176 = ATCC 8290]